MAYISLISALGVLLVGPIVYGVFQRQKRSLDMLQGFVFVALVVVVFGVILPEAYEAVGWLAIVATFAGISAPNLLERLKSVGPEFAHNSALVLAIFALALHMILDGIALNINSESSVLEPMLAFGVILHRIPVSIGLWWMLRSGFRRSTCWGALVLLAIATAIGFSVADQLRVALDNQILVLFQAFVAGTLVHVLLHQHSLEQEHDHSSCHTSASDSNTWEALGGIVGLVVTFCLMFLIDHGHGASFGGRFLDLMILAAPALLLGYFFAGILHVFLSAKVDRWFHVQGAFRQSARGVAFGAPIPVCSCGVVPLYQTLVKRGVPPTSAFAFLIATPEIGIESFLLSFPLLGTEVALLRLLAALLVAFGVAVILGRFVADTVSAVEVPESTEETLSGTARFRAALSYGFRDVVDDTAAWILLGLVVAAAIDPSALQSTLQQISPSWQVLLASLAGIPMYICASGATPLAAALIFAGVSPGAAIAFLLAGPATNVTTFGVLRELHGLRVSISFGVAMVLGAIAAGLAVNMVAPQPLLEVHTHAHGGLAVLAWLSVGLVTLLFVGAFWRKGPRAFLGHIFSGGRHETHDQVHDHSDTETSSCCSSH